MPTSAPSPSAAPAPSPPTSLFQLDGRCALVTGAARGLGRAIALALAAHGARVWLGGRDTQALQALAEHIGPRALVLPFDIADPAATSAAVASVLDQGDRLDIVVNAVGQRRREPLENLPAQALRELLEVNLVGAWHLCREASVPMRRQGHGRLINITSIAGPLARAGDAAYTTSKGGLEAMTRAFAAELGPHGITANAIAPGYFATETNASMVDDAEVADWLRRRTSIGRWGRPEEIAAAAVFLASDAAGYVSGQTLAVDGGYMSHF